MTLTATERSSGASVKSYAATVNVTGSQDPTPVAAVPLTGDLQFVPLATPRRLLDTRPDAQSLGPRSRVDVKVAGVAGVPADAKAVVLNVTAVNSAGVTYVSAWPAGAARPGSSVLNVDAGRTAATGVMVGVGGEGKVSLYNNAGSTHLVADVTGYYVASGGNGYGALAAPARLYDSRTKDGPLRSGQVRTVQVAGKGGVPADARAVVLNVTSAKSLGPGHVVAYPSGSAVPATSTVNQMPGQDVANRTVVGLSGGKINLSAQGAGSDVVVDVVGWFGPGGGTRFTPIVPRRMFDTRVSGGALGAGATRTLTAPSSFPVPSDAAAVAMVVTATKQTSYATYVTVWAGAGIPGTSDLNTGKGRDQSNLVLSRWASPGAVRAYNDLGSTHLVGDAYGYFR